MIKQILGVFKPSNRSLIRELVISDFKLRYQNSVLGYLWSLLKPLMMFGVLYIVFTKIIRVGGDIPYYPQYLLLGLVLWTFFTEATQAGMGSIAARGDMIRKVSIPKYTIVISSTLSAFVNFLLNMLVVLAFMVIGGVDFHAGILWAPVYILELVIFSLGISFLLSALFVKFRDFGHIWDVILQILFYATPIIYTLNIVPARLIKLVSINPLAQIFQDIRQVMITPETLTTQEVFNTQLGRAIPFTIIIVITVVGVWYFRRASKNFAEEL